MALFGGSGTAGRSTSFSFGGSSSGSALNNSGPSQAGGSLFSFGNSNAASSSAQQQQQQQQQQQPAGSSLFGQQQQQQPQQQTGTGLFGQQQQQPQQQTGTGLFGQQQQQQPQQQTGSTGGLFGSNTGAAAGGSSLFGQPKPTTTSLFGQGNTTQQPGGSSLFGNSTQQQQKPFSFGAPASQPQQSQQNAFSFGTQQPGAGTSTGLFGQSGLGSGFGAQQQQPQQQNGMQPGQFGNLGQQGAAGINSPSPFARQAYHQRERFNDLPEDSKKLLTELDSFINGQLRIKDELASRDYGSDIRKRQTEWSDLHSALGNTHVVLQQDAELIKSVVESVERDRTDYITMLEIAQNYKDNKSDGKQWTSWPGEFFARAAGEYRERMVRYRATIDAIERQLSTIDTSSEHSPELIAGTIQNQHAVFMALASQVAGIHAEVDQLRRDYTQWYQQQYRSVQDPFAMSQLTSTI